MSRSVSVTRLFSRTSLQPVIARHSLCSLLVAGCCLALSGCGETKMPWETVYKAEGRVTLDGKPVSGAQVYLYPTSSEFPEEIRPTATTDQDGKFVLGTNSIDDGAPAGEYKATVLWYKLVDKGGGAVRGPNALPVKYSKPETSQLIATIAESPETTTLPTFELRSN